MSNKEKALKGLKEAFDAVQKLPNNKRAKWDRAIRNIAVDIELVG